MASGVPWYNTTAGAAGISATGGLLSGIVTGIYNASQARANRNFQREMYQRQYEDSIKFWQMQNQYSLPSAQVQRLKDANLNPLLYYSGGQIGQPVTPPDVPSQPSGAQASAAFSNPLEMAQYALLDAQRQKISAESTKITSETNWQELENKWQRDSYNVRLMLMHGEYDKVRAIIRDYNDQIFQRGFINAQQAATMAQARIYEIKRFNLDEKAITTGLEQRWNELATNRIAANAQLKNACANWLNAVTNSSEAKWRIGAMAQDIYYKSQYQPYMLKNMSLQNELNKFDVGIKANEIIKGYNYNQIYKNSQGANDIPMWMAPFFIYSNMKDPNPNGMK